MLRRGAALLLVGLMVYACTVTESASDDDGSSSTANAGSGGSTGPGMDPPDATEICEMQCVPVHPNGENDYRALRYCLLCQACFSVCEPDTTASMCLDGSEGGCSALAATCAECIVNPCAMEQLPDLGFSGFCTPQAANCSNNIDCVSLNNCIAQCVIDSTPMP